MLLCPARLASTKTETPCDARLVRNVFLPLCELGGSDFDSYGSVGYTLEQKLVVMQRVML